MDRSMTPPTPVHALLDHPVWATPLQGWQLIEASAGTGKTWTMAGLFVRAVIELGVPLEGILTLTYTRAATDELKRRITKELLAVQLALSGTVEPEPGSFPDSVVSCYHDELLRTQALQRLEVALANLDGLAVFTLHGFGQRVARLYSTSLGLAPDQQVTTDQKTWLRPALDRFWHEMVGSSNALATILVQLDLSPVSLLSLMEQALSFPLAAARSPLRTASAIAEDLFLAWRAFRTVDREQWTAHGEWLKTQKWDTRHPSTKKAAVVNSAFVPAWALGDNPIARGKAFKGIEKNALEAFTGDARVDATQVPSVELFRLCSSYLRAYAALQELPAAIAYEFRCWCQLHLAGIKRELGLQTHDDALLSLVAALQERQTGLALAASIAKRFPVAFIDESQDTDRVPWTILEAIYANAGGPDTAAARCLVAVGDPKQSIYRFRGADVHEFLHIASKVEQPRTLGVNRRSQPLLVEAVNAMFARPHAFGLKGLNFEPAQALPASAGEPQVLQPLRWTWLAGDNRKELRSKARAMLASRLLAELATGTQEGEIAILVHTNKQARWVKQTLDQAGVSSIVMSRDLVYDSDEASELLTLMRALSEPGRIASLRAACSTRLIGATARELLDPVRTEQLGELFQRWRLQVSADGLYGALRAGLVAQGCFERLMSLVDGERRITNLQQLLDLMRRAQPRLHTLSAAIQWLERVKQDDGRDEGAELLLENDDKLVHIVTVHRSKGLQYPVVFMPFAWDQSRRQSSEWSGPFLDHEEQSDTAQLDFRHPLPNAVEERKQLEECSERVRQFYVAVTRAERTLYIFLAESQENRFCAPAGVHLALDLLQDGKMRLESLCAEVPDAMAMDQEEERSEQPVQRLRIAPTRQWQVRPSPAPLPQAWSFSSYSSLVRATDKAQERAQESAGAADLDVFGTAPLPPEVTAESDSIRERFTAGAQAGIALHSILEQRDFRSQFTNAEMLRLLQRNAMDSGSAAQVASWLNEVLATTLGTRALNTLAPGQCLSEMEFMLAARAPARNPGSAPGGDLREALAGVSLDRPRAQSLNAPELDGLLRGFIDLVIEDGGRYYVLDWKSNHLGYSIDAYSQDSMRAAMIEHRYDWQAALYLVALHRYLRTSLPDYDPSRHLGGAWYVFLRGAGDPRRAVGSGVYHVMPALSALMALDEVLCG